MAVRMEISGRLISLVTCLRLRLFLVRLLSDLGNFHTAFAVATEFSCDNSGRAGADGWRMGVLLLLLLPPPSRFSHVFATPSPPRRLRVPRNSNYRGRKEGRSELGGSSTHSLTH